MMKSALLPILGLVLLMAAPAPAAAQAGRGLVFHRTNPQAVLSQIVEAGNTVYLSGMLGTTAEGTLAPGGIQPETRQALENVRAALARVGATMDHVVKCTVFLADMAERDAMNEVYLTFFPDNRPARSAVGVSGLARDARVEIECIAVRGV